MMKPLPEEFMERMRLLLGEKYGSFLKSYEEPPKRGLRVNTLKISPGEFSAISPWELESTGILPEGFVVHGAESIGRHPFHAAGLFYMQEPSAMSAVAACPADGSGLRVLDMCAAPGGKSGGAAAKMCGNGILVSNEIVGKRAFQLSFNLERLGVTNAAVISAKPEDIARELPCFFDIVLVDAPCSGEGMFRKDDTAIGEWSPEHVKSCAVRQGLILDSAEKCLAPGGCIVYSTCTFSREENEGVIEDFLSKHADFSVELMERLYPHASCGEGHFVCRLRREGAPLRADFEGFEQLRDRQALSLLDSFVRDTLESALPEGTVYRSWDALRLVPRGMPAAVMRLRPYSVGAELIELKKNRCEPTHGFFMAALGQEFRRSLIFEPDDPALSAFLAGNTVPCPDSWRGWCAVCVNAGGRAFPIGFGKAVDGVMKNHIPKGLYINR